LSGLAGQEAQAINCGSRLGQKGAPPPLRSLKPPRQTAKVKNFACFCYLNPFVAPTPMATALQ